MKNGKNICLLHGWGGSPEKLGPLESELQKLGWNTYCPELPFFSMPDEKRPWNSQDFADFVTKQCTKRFGNKKYYLFGHSNGGRISIKLASQHQERLGGVVLCASAGISRTSLAKRVLLKTISYLFSPIKYIPILNKIFKKVTLIYFRNYDYYKIVSDVKRETFKLLIKENLKRDALKITIPVLILWGTKDRLTPVKDAYWLSENLQSTSVEIFRDQPHALPILKPMEIASSINKWAK